MPEGFVMRTEASQVMNFLIYIQNQYLNQKGIEGKEYKFPYYSTIKIDFRPDFKEKFKEIWSRTVQKVSEHPMNHTKSFIEEKNSFYKSLIVESPASLEEYYAFYQSFQVWWNSTAGFVLERAVDGISEKIYKEVTEFLEQKEISAKGLNIALVYDDYPLVDEWNISPELSIIPVKEFYFDPKGLLTKIKAAIY